MVVKNSVRGPDYRLAVPFRVPRNSETRLEIVLVGLNPLLQSKQVVGRQGQPLRRRELRRDLNVVPHSVVDGQVVARAPAVLPERSNWTVADRAARAAQSLNVIARQSRAIGLNRREPGKVRQCSRDRIHKSK